MGVAFWLVRKIQNALKKNFKIKCLLKEDVDINEELNISCPGEMEIMKLKTDIDSLEISLNTLMLLPNSGGKLLYILKAILQRNIGKKIKSSSCCKIHITGSVDVKNPDHEYVIIFNREGLTIPSPNLVNYVRDAFAVLTATGNVLINQS